MGKPNPDDAARSNRILGIILTVTLAVSMVPVALLPAFADEPVERPATTGGDAALEGYSAESVPVATQREDGMYVADGLVYTVTDGGLSLVGFDGLPQGENALKEIVIPEAVSVDGKDTAVVSVAIAEDNVAEGIVSLTLPQSINDVDTATLVSAFPNLASVEIATPKASAPVAAGAAAIRAAYSSFGGVLYKNAWVATDGDASQTTLAKELVWAPAATVVARIPAECASIAPGAFAAAKELKTVVCFGVMGEIPQTQKADDGTVTPGAFTDGQVQTVNVIVPQTGTVVPDPDGGRVSADVAVTDHSTMDIKRESWWKAGFASDRITLGEVYGSTTNTLPVTDEGVLETAEAEVAYAPETTQNYSSRKAGIEPPASAIPTPVPDDDELDPSESGLVFTHLADMTLSVRWKGDPTATPAHLDIPAYATINGVTYPVTEIAPEAFKGAVFLTSIMIPETVKTIGDSAFEGCTNLAEAGMSSTLKETAAEISAEDSTSLLSFEENEINRTISPHTSSPDDDAIIAFGSTSTYSIFEIKPTNLGGDILVQISGAVVKAEHSAHRIIFGYNYGGEYYAGAYVSNGGTIQVVWRRSSDGAITASAALHPPAGWSFASVSSNAASLGSTVNADCIYGIVLVRDEVAGDAELLTETNAASRYAAKDHNHDGVYAKDSEIKKWVDENYLTKAATDLDNFYDKAAFNTISYAGLEDASYTGALPTFYVDDASKLPTVPEPRRDGYAFRGWTWGSETTPSKDASGAFSSGGPVTLTAVWEEAEPETPEATHFFTGERPLRFDDASERQTHVIKVRLSNVPRTLASVSFEGDDRTHLLKDTSGVELYVGAGEDALASGTRLPWGGSTGSGWTCALAKLSDDSYGVYVGISVPTAAIDEASVPVSYTDGSYVASLVKMNYVFA